MTTTRPHLMSRPVDDEPSLRPPGTRRLSPHLDRRHREWGVIRARVRLWVWTLVRFFVAFEMMRYGTAVGMQFYTRYYFLDTRPADMTPMALAWTFFGLTYGYQAIALRHGIRRRRGLAAPLRLRRTEGRDGERWPFDGRHFQHRRKALAHRRLLRGSVRFRRADARVAGRGFPVILGRRLGDARGLLGSSCDSASPAPCSCSSS